jgi:ribonuclease HI
MSASVTIFVDGSVSGTQYAGIAAVARTKEGYFIGWRSAQLDAMTNNEAEYHAAMLGLALARHLGATQVEIVSDSEVVVRQMQGRSRVNSARLQPLHQRTWADAARFQHVSFRHVGREKNQIADALATEALHGRIVRMRPQRHRQLAAS